VRFAGRRNRATCAGEFFGVSCDISLKQIPVKETETGAHVEAELTCPGKPQPRLCERVRLESCADPRANVRPLRQPPMSGQAAEDFRQPFKRRRRIISAGKFALFFRPPAMCAGDGGMAARSRFVAVRQHAYFQLGRTLQLQGQWAEAEASSSRDGIASHPDRRLDGARQCPR